MNKRLFLLTVLSAVLLASCGDDSSSSSGNGGATMPACGDGKLNDGEACDDGNTNDGDGCAADCSAIEDGYACDENGCNKDPDFMPDKPICGNSKLEDGETCDDGNRSSGDGCSNTCQIEDGYKCETQGQACIALPRCGNGIIEDGEACDDANTKDGDGCKADCSAAEDGYKCPIPGSECTKLTCGDGVMDDGEECDNGDYNIDYSYDPADCASNCERSHYCGDGKLDQVDRDNGEQCDNGGVDTSSEYGGCSLSCQRVNYCGDGKITHNEQCDDGNTTDNDGCSSKCEYAGDFSCKTINGKTVCTPLLCGNGVIDENELCDDGNRSSGDGCSSSCTVEKGWRCEADADNKSVCIHTCGNGLVTDDEACDDGNTAPGDGCSAICTVENGYLCSAAADAPSVCYARACGDGIIAGDEECDDGNTDSEDGCSKYCKREEGYHCAMAGKACEEDMCGDGLVTGDETCDEGKSEASGGCVDCQIQMGWKCPAAGEKCAVEECGNGTMAGAEECDETSECCSACILADHCACDADGKNCKKGACGNGVIEKGEVCDDGNLNAGDGCCPECTVESIFSCYNGVCKATCGDGLTLVEAGEECDDGNLANGDGCSSDCKIEDGFSCTKFDNVSEPSVLNLPIVYRDFRAYHFGKTNHGDYGNYANPQPGKPGFFSQDEFDALPDACKKNSGYRFRHFPIVGSPIPDFNGNGCYGNNRCSNVVYPDLNSKGRPILRPAHEMTRSPQATSSFDGYEECRTLYTCPEVFDYWYKDSSMSLTIKSTLPLKREVKNGKTVYHFLYTDNGYADSNFWPLDGKGFHAPNAATLYGVREAAHGLFTTEFQSYFKYNGGETLTFAGDDDVWVFFNGHLALEFAGIHGNWQQSITLTEERAKAFGMYPGGIYSLQMFHAERCQGGSTFELSLTGFINMGTSTCATACGDGLIRGEEECDFTDIPADMTYPVDTSNVALQQRNGCSATCTHQPFCGNNKIEKGEACDTDESWCNDKCLIATCGNGALDEPEQCDLSAPQSDKNIHAGCQSTCLFAGCGDGNLDDGEECDDGNKSNEDMCTEDCTVPKCGDGIVSPALGEVCDDGINDGSYGGCGFGCTYVPPFCGDGLVDNLSGEECDNGKDVNVGGYGACKPDCTFDIRCGDGLVQPEYGEACDPNDALTGAACNPATCQKIIL